MAARLAHSVFRRARLPADDRPAVASRAYAAMLTGLLLLFLGVSIVNIDRVPPVFEDEPWQASTGWKIARDGVFGSDMFAGYHGMERHYYGYMPVHPLLLAATFRVAGVGVEQMRVEAAILALLTVALTWLIAHRLFGPTVALLAVALLVLVRLLGQSPLALTGIPLVDGARIARYDIAVPVFGLAALLACVHARERPGWFWLAVSGMLSALAGLSHVYGMFWFAAIALLALWDRARPRQLVALAAGFTIPWLAYAGWVLPHVDDWRGQTRIYGSRFELLDPGWYFGNLLREYHRYGPGLGPAGWGWLERPGFWVALVVLPASLAALGRRAVRGDRAARALVVPATVIPVLFALTLQVKQAGYLLTIVPLGAIVAAWGVVALWRWLPAFGWGRSARLALAGVGVLVAVEGAGQLRAVENATAAGTPYDAYVARLRAETPPGARVLGVHTWWLGFYDADYHAWLVPLLLADPRYEEAPLAIDAALDGGDPEVVLIEAELRAVLDARADLGPVVDAWLARHGFALVATIDDPTWGSTEVYRRDVAGGS